MVGPQSESNKGGAAAIRKELEMVYLDEDLYWRQRAKHEWDEEGDTKSKFFHAKASARKQNNEIFGLLDELGGWQEDREGMANIIQSYFGPLFQTSNPSVELIDEILEIINPRVTTEMNLQLARPYSTEDVSLALSQMSPMKSPGPDGLPALFFQKYWHILGSNISHCVLDFLDHHNMPAALNYTFIVLIPKVSSTKKMSEFRLISLCSLQNRFESSCQ